GKVLLIYIIEQSYKGNTPVIVEKIYIPSGKVAVIRSITSIDFSKLPIPHVFFSNNIDGFGGVSIIKACELRLVAQLIKYLDFVNDFRRQITKGCRCIIAKKISPINRYFLDSFALCCYGTRLVHGNPGHFLYQVFSGGIGIYFVLICT